jgi:hypothetical protein
MTFVINILAWLVGSKAGRITVFSLAGLALVAVIALNAFRKGQQNVRTKQVERALDNIMKRVAVDEAVSRLPPDARRERLRQWVRD